METPDQIKAARAALRSAIFDLVRDKVIREPIGLHLLRTVEATLRTPDQPTSIGVPHALYIEDEDEPVSWRAYPCEETTIEELLRACQAFPIQPWVDVDSRVCLILRNAKIGEAVPTAMQLIEAMYGLGDVAQWPPSEVKKWTPPELKP